MPETSAVAGTREFARLLEAPIHPGQEQNARIVDQFNRGQATADDVLRVTSTCLRRAGDNWNAAVACLQALGRCRHPQTGQGVFPNTITYNAAISACEKGGRADKALELFDHLLTHGPARNVFPNTITFNAAICACEKGGRADKALELFDHLLTHGPARNIFPNSITYSAAISACEKGGRVDRYAELLLSGINGVPGRPDTKVFQPSLGFDPNSNTLDSHERSALMRLSDPKGRNPAVHPAVARAIFHVLLNEPEKILEPGAVGINDKTAFVVGQHGEGFVKDAIAGCMLDQGWTPVHQVASNGVPNPGCLVTQPGQEMPEPSRASSRTLNPLAKGFKPGQWALPQ